MSTSANHLPLPARSLHHSRRLQRASVALLGSLAIPTVAGYALAAPVATSAELQAAVAAATPGTTITLAPGAYALQAPLTTAADGTMAMPITLTSAKAQGVRLDFSSADGLVIKNAYWVLDGITVNGTCESCQFTAVRVQPTATHLTVRSSRFKNFSFGIVGERTANAEPTDVLIDTNEFYNEGGRVAAGGTPFHVIGGKRWVITTNYMHDFAGSQQHPGMLLAGGFADGLVKRNLIMSDKAPPMKLASKGSSLGFSLGGQDTPPASCAADNRDASSCKCEVSQSVIHNNIVIGTTGHGVRMSRVCGYADPAKKTQIRYNTLYRTTPGLEVVTPGPVGAIDYRYQLMTGAMLGVAPADMAESKAEATEELIHRFYVAPEEVNFNGAPERNMTGLGDVKPIEDVGTDYTGDVGNERPATIDYGAVNLRNGQTPTWPWAGYDLIGGDPTTAGPPGGDVVPGTGAGGAGGTGGAPDMPDPPGTGGTLAAGGTSGAPEAGAGGSALPGVGGNSIPGSGGSSDGGATASTGGSSQVAASPDSSGCSLKPVSDSHRTGWSALLLLGLGIAGARSRRR